MEFTQELRERFEKLSSTNLSDAMDALGMRGFTLGIRPMEAHWRKIVGPAVTMRMTAAGQTPQKTHLGMNAIAAAKPGDIILGDSSGIVCVPQEKMLEILEKAEQLWQKEEDMIAEIKAGADILAVDAKYNYNKMLQK